MAEQENVALMRRWFQEIWNDGRTGIVRELLTPGAKAVGTAEHDSTIRGPEEFLKMVATMRGAFPDMRIVVEDAFGAGDKVCIRWSLTATHKGAELGIPPTNKPVEVTGITVVRFENGKIVAGWDQWDQFRLMKEIGAIDLPKARMMKAG